MKQSVIILLACVLLPLLTASCDLHSSDNGDLDGFWQMNAVDTLGRQTTDLREEKLFWAVQGDLLEMVQLKGNLNEKRHWNLLFRFEMKGSTLRVYSPRYKNKLLSDSIVTNVDDLRPYGLNQLDQTFRVEQMDGSAMTLASDQLRLHFRKY